jgi:hypothetical protein
MGFDYKGFYGKNGTFDKFIKSDNNKQLLSALQRYIKSKINLMFFLGGGDVNALTSFAKVESLESLCGFDSENAEVVKGYILRLLNYPISTDFIEYINKNDFNYLSVHAILTDEMARIFFMSIPFTGVPVESTGD